MTAGKWRDKRDVYFLSTLYRDESEPVNRRAKEGETETVNKPKIVTLRTVILCFGVLSLGVSCLLYTHTTHLPRFLW